MLDLKKKNELNEKIAALWENTGCISSQSLSKKSTGLPFSNKLETVYMLKMIVIEAELLRRLPQRYYCWGYAAILETEAKGLILLLRDFSELKVQAPV